jgi:hypothetical protein
MMNYYWRYVGCPTGSVPPELMSDRDMHPIAIKELLKNIQTKEGVLQAANEETVVRLLFNNDIFPIRIRKLSKKDIKLINLRKMQRQLNGNVEEKINIIQPQKRNKKHLTLILVTLALIIIGAKYVYNYMF